MALGGSGQVSDSVRLTCCPLDGILEVEGCPYQRAALSASAVGIHVQQASEDDRRRKAGRLLACRIC
jgi:hypothetical protein